MTRFFGTRRIFLGGFNRGSTPIVPVTAGNFGMYGNGLDGPATIDDQVHGGVTYLDRDMYWTDVEIINNGTLNTNNYRVFVSGTLTIDSTSTITNNGNSGDSNGDPPSAAVVGTLGRGGTGGTGGWGAGNPTGDGGAGEQVLQALGGNSGEGGTSVTWTGGADALAFINELSGGLGIARAFPGILQGCLPLGRQRVNGGAGGGGGASDADDTIAPSGGNGGNPILISARNIICSGIIQSHGGNGADADPFNTNDAGGGGAGGGGFICIFTDIADPALLSFCNVDGGLGGLPTGTGDAGHDGNVGNIYIIQNQA